METLQGDDIIRWVLQYLKANSLNESFATLQRESGVAFNLIPSHAEIKNNIMEGNWDKVVSGLKDVALPPEVHLELYDQMICELCEAQEFELAAFIMKQHGQEMIDADKARYSQLLGIVKTKKLPPNGLNAVSRREKLAEDICTNITELKSPSRLIDLIQQGLLKESEKILKKARVQPDEPIEKPDAKIEEVKKDVKKIEPMQIEEIKQTPVEPVEPKEHKETAKEEPAKKPIESPYIQTVDKKRRTQEKYHLKAGRFSNDGNSIATASADGFIEILDSKTLDLRPDLEYQGRKKFMLHEKKVLCLDFSSDDKMLCSGDETGLIKVWRISDGKCLRKLEHAHDKGITCCKFLSSNSQVMSGSFNSLLRIHGLKSGALLKEFPGHISYVTDLILLDSETTAMSSSSDGTIKLWDVKSGILKQSFTPGNITKEISINNIVKSPDKELFAVCNRSPFITVIDRHGKSVVKLSTEKPAQGDFLAVAYSNDGKWIYAAAQDLNIYIFSASSGELQSTLKAHGKEMMGMAHHPSIPLLMTYATDGYLYLWKA